MSKEGIFSVFSLHNTEISAYIIYIFAQCLMPETVELQIEEVSEAALVERIRLRKVKAAVDMYDQLVQAGRRISRNRISDDTRLQFIYVVVRRLGEKLKICVSPSCIYSRF